MSKSFVQRFLSWSETSKNCFYIGAVAVIVSLCLLPFAFYSNPGVPLGFLIAGAASIIAYLSIAWGSSLLLSQKDMTGAKGAVYSVLFNLLRLAIYGAVLAVAALSTFHWHNNWFNFWSVAAGFLPMPVILAITSLIRNRQKGPVEDLSMHKMEDPEEEKVWDIKEEEVDEDDRPWEIKPEEEIDYAAEAKRKQQEEIKRLREENEMLKKQMEENKKGDEGK